MRLSLLALSVLIPSPVAPTLPAIVIQPESIVQVICFGKGDISSGSAFRVGPTGLLISVNHVTSTPHCFISGKPINLAYKSPTSDFSELQGEEGPYIGVDCGGFVKGRRYLALGYGRGLPTISTVELVGTGEYDPDGQAILKGLFAVVPGMSGGAIISEDTGRVVGTVNAENFEEGLSWSVELKRTPVCRNA